MSAQKCDRKGLFAERLGGYGEHAGHPEGLGEVARDAEVDRLVALASVENPVMMMTGMSAFRRRASRTTVSPVDFRHLEIRRYPQVVGDHAEPLERRAPVGRQVDVVFGKGQRFREEVANSRPRRPRRECEAGPPPAPPRGSRPPAPELARPLALQPRIDVAFPEPPLPPDSDRGNLPRLDEAIDRSEIYLESIRAPPRSSKTLLRLREPCRTHFTRL